MHAAAGACIVVSESARTGLLPSVSYLLCLGR